MSYSAVLRRLRLAAASAAALATLFAFAPAVSAQICAYNSTQGTCACPTSGGGTTCFGGQLYRSTDSTCQSDARPCSASQQWNCASEACECNTTDFPCGGCTAESSTPGAACGSPTGGQYTNSCGVCGCPSGTTLCGASNTCVTNLVCPQGTLFDACTNSCGTPYVIRSPAWIQDGYIQIAGDIKSTNGDFYLANGKALRIDGAGATALNIGNWGGGATGFSVNVFGSISGGEVCVNGDCRSSWPATADYEPSFTNSAGDTMTGDLNLTGASTDLFVAGNVGVGTTNPGAELDVVGTTRTTGFQLTTGAGAGKILTSDASGNGTWQTAAAGGIGGSGTTNYVPKFTAAGTIGNSLIYDTGATIGIGTTNPTYLLDVAGGNVHVASGTNFTSVWVDRATTAQFAVTSYATAGAGQWDIGLGNNGTEDFQFRNFSGSNRVTIQQGGNVGIGTPSPAAKLDVAGTARIDGFTMPTGAANGRILTSDASGNGTWQAPAAGGGVSSVSGSGAGVSVSPTTGAVVVSNTGVTSLSAGSGISLSGATGAVTVSSTGVSSIVAGTDMSVSGSGAVTVNNTSTLQTVTNRGATTNKSVTAGGNSVFFGIEGQGTSTGVSGWVWGNNGQAVVGNALNVSGGTGGNFGGTGTGVFGNSPSGYGVYGQGGTGVYGTGSTYGGDFTSSSTALRATGTGSGAAVYANNTGGGYGVVANGSYAGVNTSGSTWGTISSGSSGGVWGTSPGTWGVYATGGTYGVQANGSSYGVHGTGSYGVYGQGGGTGVYGNGSTYGVYGNSSGTGGFFYNSSTTANAYMATGGYSMMAYGTLYNAGNAQITGALTSANLTTGAVYSTNYIQAAYDLIAENNSWGSGSGWISCPYGGYCNCPGGSFVSDLYDAGTWMYCRKP